jgi:hypothetical protein
MSGRDENEIAERALREALAMAREELPNVDTMHRMEAKIADAVHGGGGPPWRRATPRAVTATVVLGIAAALILTWTSFERNEVTPRVLEVTQENPPMASPSGAAESSVDSEVVDVTRIDEPAARSLSESEGDALPRRRHRRSAQREEDDSRPPRPQVPAAPEISESPNDEITIIRAARRALATEPERALSFVEQHRREFENGILAEEREVLAVEALAALGRRAEAERRASQFRARWSASPYRTRIDAALRRF